MSLQFIEIQQSSSPLDVIEVGRGLATYTLLVESTAERLLLPASTAAGKTVVQESDSSAWVLVADGDPSNPSDWVQINFFGDMVLDGGDPSSSYSFDPVSGGTP